MGKVFNPHKFVYWVRSLPFSLFMYLKEKQYKIAMILLCPGQGPWASSLFDIHVIHILISTKEYSYFKRCRTSTSLIQGAQILNIQQWNWRWTISNFRALLITCIHIYILQYFSTTQLGYFSSAQAQAVSQNQLNALTPAQISTLESVAGTSYSTTHSGKVKIVKNSYFLSYVLVYWIIQLNTFYTDNKPNESEVLEGFVSACPQPWSAV